jgi:hypothetical protein
MSPTQCPLPRSDQDRLSGRDGRKAEVTIADRPLVGRLKSLQLFHPSERRRQRIEQPLRAKISWLSPIFENKPCIHATFAVCVPVRRIGFPDVVAAFPARTKNFPVPLRREFLEEIALDQVLRAPGKGLKRHFRTKFPVNTLICREFGPEKGSHQTASSANLRLSDM